MALMSEYSTHIFPPLFVFEENLYVNLFQVNNFNIQSACPAIQAIYWYNLKISTRILNY